MTWWVWVAGGIILGLLEIAVPGYAFLGFAVGAVITGLLMLLGVVLTGPWAWVVCGFLSLVAWFAFRRLLGSQAGDVKIIKHDINDN